MLIDVLRSFVTEENKMEFMINLLIKVCLTSSGNHTLHDYNEKFRKLKDSVFFSKMDRPRQSTDNYKCTNRECLLNMDTYSPVRAYLFQEELYK